MTRISAADQLLALLRAQLERRAKQGRKSATTQRGAERQLSRSAIQRLRGITSDSDLTDATIQRSLVQALLLEEFGEEALNDPHFQATIDRVLQQISAHDAGRALIQRTVTDLGS